MIKIYKNTNGFTVVEGLLIVLVVAVIGFGGYYVWHTQHKTTTASVTTASSNKPAATKTTTTTTKPANTLPTGLISTTDITGSYSYPGNIFTVSYPSSWTENAQAVPTAAVQPDILATNNLTTAVTVSPPNAAQGETAGITAFKPISLANAISEFFVGQSPQVVTSKSLTINGYNALYQQVASSGSKTTDCYAVTNNSYTVVFDFVPNGTGDPSASTDFNATALLPDFNAIVSSIKFN